MNWIEGSWKKFRSPRVSEKWWLHKHSIASVSKILKCIFEALRCVRYRFWSRKWIQNGPISQGCDFRANPSTCAAIQRLDKSDDIPNSLSWGEWIELQPNCCQMKMQDYTKCNPRSLLDPSFLFKVWWLSLNNYHHQIHNKARRLYNFHWHCNHENMNITYVIGFLGLSVSIRVTRS